jgi:hypothetical protein
MKDKNGVVLDYDQIVRYKNEIGKIIEFLEEVVDIKTIKGEILSCKPEELEVRTLENFHIFDKFVLEYKYNI